MTRGPEAESPAAVAELAPRSTITVMTTDAWTSFAVPGAPYFVVVDGRDGSVVGEGTGAALTQVARFVVEARADNRHAPTPRGAGRLLGGSLDHDTRAEAELRRAGLEPGDARLYPAPEP